MTAVHLRRIDATRNMRRFYRLDMQPDLFGGVLLVRHGDALAQKGAALLSISTTRRLQSQHSRNMRRVRRGGVTPDFCVVRMTRFSLNFRAFSQTALPRIE